MEGNYCYSWPRPSLTADSVIFRHPAGKKPEVLLIERGREPYQGCWAFPGGFVNPNEEPLAAAIRELHEETGIDLSTVSQTDPPQLVGIYGKAGRDPRGWTVSATYFHIVDCNTEVIAGDDAANCAWFPVDNLPRLAFDHQDMFDDTMKMLATGKLATGKLAAGK